VNYYKLAADQGYAIAQCNIGQCYFRGEGVQKDSDKAFHYFQLAANQGDEGAMAELKKFFNKVYI